MTTKNTPTHFADRLIATAHRFGSPACVGLDPVYDRLPVMVRESGPDPVAAIETFCLGVLDAIQNTIGIVKVQSACFERYAGAGIDAMGRIIADAHDRGMAVILDAKRGDIGISATHYAAFAFDAMNADALTVNAYLGVDTLEPYLEKQYADRGIFVLVRTSNSNSDSVQSPPLADGRTVAEMMADLVVQAGRDSIGECGLSSVGAVVAATKPDDAKSLRERMPNQIFLVPGFGAQGGSIETVRELFRPSGEGAIVTASRSVIYAYDEKQLDKDWQQGIENEACAHAQIVVSFAGARASTPLDKSEKTPKP